MLRPSPRCSQCHAQLVELSGSKEVHNSRPSCCATQGQSLSTRGNRCQGMTQFQGTVARSEQLCGLCSGVLTSIRSCRVFVRLLTQVERFTVSQSRDRG
jgi:hypothetical protein